jgi:hypothetical protein
MVLIGVAAAVVVLVVALVAFLLNGARTREGRTELPPPKPAASTEDQSHRAAGLN